MHVLRRGSEGNDVRVWQEFLHAMHYEAAEELIQEWNQQGVLA